MKRISLVIVAMGLFIVLKDIGSAAELSPALKELAGKWTASRTNQDGEKYTFSLEFKGDKVIFHARDAEGKPRLVAKGTAKAMKEGPFNVLTLTDLQAGRSEDDLKDVDDERSSVYALRDGNLLLASNFDKERRNETPRVDEYSRAEASARAESSAPKLTGKWKMELALGDQTRDYELNIEGAGDKLQATVISPRSGEHKAKSVSFKDGEFEMLVDREIQGSDMTIVYKGKLAEGKLAGKVSVKGLEEQYSGTWTATR